VHYVRAGITLTCRSGRSPSGTTTPRRDSAISLNHLRSIADSHREWSALDSDQSHEARCQRRIVDSVYAGPWRPDASDGMGACTARCKIHGCHRQPRSARILNRAVLHAQFAGRDPSGALTAQFPWLKGLADLTKDSDRVFLSSSGIGSIGGVQPSNVLFVVEGIFQPAHVQPLLQGSSIARPRKATPALFSLRSV
jgi:hypothetical protein